MNFCVYKYTWILKTIKARNLRGKISLIKHFQDQGQPACTAAYNVFCTLQTQVGLFSEIQVSTFVNVLQSDWNTPIQFFKLSTIEAVKKIGNEFSWGERGVTKKAWARFENWFTKKSLHLLWLQVCKDNSPDFYKVISGKGLKSTLFL